VNLQLYCLNVLLFNCFVRHKDSTIGDGHTILNECLNLCKMYAAVKVIATTSFYDVESED
jgi:hypothetical protein